MNQRQSLQQILPEQLDVQKNKSRSITKIISKWIIELNAKHKIIKLLENNRGENLDDLGYGDAFLDTTSNS